MRIFLINILSEYADTVLVRVKQIIFRAGSASDSIKLTCQTVRMTILTDTIIRILIGLTHFGLRD